jgi:Zn-dependent protease with chaperone function
MADAARINFFEAQAVARRQSGRLVLLFALAVAGLSLAATFVIAVAFGLLQAQSGAGGMQWNVADPRLLALVAAGICLLVAVGSLLKAQEMKAGGRVVAEALGGQLVPADTRDPALRRLRNVVEEMAIAAGLPLPALYLIDEPGINAFAAGHTPRDAVIGVTRGAVQQLNREELQGVIGHEFSHILGGDMARNIQLTGWLHGILLLGLIGQVLLRSGFWSGGGVGRDRDRRGGAQALALAGLGLILIGWIGTFFGRWIQAAVSRQREYLADAAAVQFTRSPDGIAGALKRIGGNAEGSRLAAPQAAEFGHYYFAAGLRGGLASLFATHPPLKERIRRLDPGWDGKWPALSEGKVRRTRRAAAEDFGGSAAGLAGAGAAFAGVAAADAAGAADSAEAATGSASADPLSERRLAWAASLLAELPAELRAESGEAHGARALLLGLLLEPDEQLRRRQLQLVTRTGDAALGQRLEQLVVRLRDLPARFRLPLMDLCVPALQAMSRRQRESFRALVEGFIAADGRTDLKEWVLQRVVLRHLDGAGGEALPRPGRASLAQRHAEIELALSLLAWTEHSDLAGARAAFSAGLQRLGGLDLRLYPDGRVAVAQLDRAAEGLAQLTDGDKRRLLQAMTALIAVDGRITIDGLELLRAFASLLDQPMPPVFGD